MPFGQRNVHAMFQRLMDMVMREVLCYSRAYIDDIVVIYSTSWSDHCEHLVAVLQKLLDGL